MSVSPSVRARRVFCFAPLSALPAGVLAASSALAAPGGGDRELTATWTGPAAGNWNISANWSTASFPSNGGGLRYHVVVDGSTKQNSTVSVNVSAQILGLAIASGDTVNIGSSFLLGVAGPVIHNDGTLRLNSSGAFTSLRLDDDVTIEGGGVLVTSNTSANRLLSSNDAYRLTNGKGHTIHGTGGLQFGLNQLELTNLGTIQAGSPTGLTLDVTDGSTLVNSGALRAMDGATLTIASTNIDNAGGLIEADAGSTVILNGPSITGGTLRDADGTGSGVLRNNGTLALKDLAIQGPFHASSGTTTLLRGSIDMQGPINISSSGSFTNLVIDASEFTLAGSSPIVNFTNTTANRVYGTGATNRLVVSPDAYIRGACQFGLNLLQLTNHGLIETDVSAGMTLNLLTAGTHANTGVIRSLNGSTLSAQGFNLDNTGGLIEAGAGSHVTFSDNHLLGGVLRDADGDGPGTIRSTGGVTLEDLTLEGPFLVNNATTLTVRGSVDIQDTLRINSSGSFTNLLLGTTPFTLSGTGATVQFTNTTANRIYGATSMHRLVIPPHGVLRGSFQLGVNTLQLTNEGLIDANISAGVTLNLTSGGTHFNSGVIRTSNGSTLDIQSTQLDNTNGLIEAGAGCIVTLNSSVLEGGTLRAADGVGSGIVRHTGGCTLRNVTVEGGLASNSATTLTLGGAMDFHGPLLVNSSGSFTNVVLEGDTFTLQGPGGTRFTNTTANRMYMATPGALLVIAPNHAVRGSFQLGLNGMSLTNHGTILVDMAAGATLDVVDTGVFLNHGLLRAQNGNVTVAQGGFENHGTVVVDAGHTLARTGHYIQHAGTTTTNGTLAPSAGSTVQLFGGTLGGTGSVSRMVNNIGGTVAPGNSAGTLTLGAGYAQGTGGALSVEIGGTTPGTQHDRLAVTGSVALAGTLVVQRVDGFVPRADQVFTILTSTGTLTGEFVGVQSCDPVTVIYGPNSVAVQFPGTSGVPADLNGDGLVNGADLGLLLAAWGECTGNPCCPADLNGDGLINGADLGLLLASWG